MQASSSPTKINIPFANSGTFNVIPATSQIGVTPGAASYPDGFPPLTMTPVTAGGVPPRGADFNGILRAITAVQQWQCGGGQFTYDTTWSAGNGGYAKGSLLLKSSGTGYWVSTADSNTTNPDGGSPANWSDLGTLLNSAVAAQQFGIGQAWQNVTGSRSAGVNYTNSTTRPIMVVVSLPDTSSLSPAVTVTVGGVAVINALTYDSGSSYGACLPTFVVPPGATYSIALTAGTIAYWAELR